MRYIIEWSDTATHRGELSLDDATLATHAMESGTLRALLAGALREPTHGEVIAMIQANAHLRMMLLEGLLAPQPLANTHHTPAL
jgi:hypothetical protein